MFSLGSTGFVAFVGFLTLAISLMTAAPAQAQLPQTRLYSLFPPGGKLGSTTEVTLTSGDDLEEINALLFNHAGIHAAQKMQESAGKKQPVANTFVVTVDANVPPGLYEVRATGRFGLSNPRTFVVGTREETMESEGNNTPDQADDIKPEATLNGQINGGTDVDYFKFTGKKDQRILVTCQAARIDSRLEPTLELHDAAGAQLAYSDHDLRDDALLDVTLPADGEYFIKLYDFIYGGGPQYVYRLLLTTGPHIDFVLPPAGLPGTTETYTLFGRNLPGGQPAGVAIEGQPLQKLDVKISLPDNPAVLKTTYYLTPAAADVDGISYVLETPAGNSNPVFIEFASAPVTLENEPNDTPAQAQTITVPGELAGQFQAKGDVDYIAFDAKAKQEYYIEVFGERQGDTADPYFVLDQVIKNDKGEEQSVKRITAQDDNNSNLLGNVFETRTDDPVFRFQVPADGTYRVSVRDRYFESRGGPRLVYRLAIRTPQPDFRLAVLPLPPAQGNNRSNATWAVALRQGDNVAADVMAFRRDGFNEPIDVWAENLPKGVVCKGATIGPGENTASLIFTATADAEPWNGLIQVRGKVRIEDAAKVQAVQQARSALQTVQTELAKQEARSKTAADALAALKGANDQLASVQETAQKTLGDENLAKLVVEARKGVDTVSQELQKVQQAKDAAAKKLADAQAALKTAQDQRQAAVQEIVRDARPATIVWSGDNNRAEIGRVAKSLGLSVLPEQAPIHVTTDVFKVEANQGRQILVPVKLEKRNGFDNNVNLTWVGLPNNSNIDVQNKPIPKGQNEDLLRLFAKTNARVGTYTLYLQSQAQVSYRRNPERAERAKAEQAKAAEALKQAQEAAQKAKQSLEEATKKATADAEALKNATAAKTDAEKKAQAADQAVKQAAEEAKKAQAAVEEAQKQAKQAVEKLAAAKKAAEADPNNKDLAEALKKAQAEAAAADEAAKKADEVKKAADKKLSDAQDTAKKANDALTTATKAFEESQKAAAQSEQAKKQAEEAQKQADAQAKAADQEKKAADKQVQDADKAAQPKNVNVFPPSTPVIIEVKPAPANLSASVPNGGNLKKGEALEIKVTVKRQNGFAGPLTLNLPLPPGVKGLAADPVTIPADKNEGVLKVQATAEATEGQLANMVVRATTEFNGEEAAVDAPINVKVSK